MPDARDNWNFSPPRLLANPHLQTILGIHWPRQAAPYRATRHVVTLDDGDRLVLHEDAPPAAAANLASVLLIHGLGGSYRSAYMTRIAERLVAAGYRVFRMDMRGCGAGEGLAKLPTHCGQEADVAAALRHLADLYPESDTSIVAFSMGGTLTMNMLAAAGPLRIGNLTRSFVICPPIELAHVERHFRTFWGRLYDRFFVRILWRQIINRWHHFPETAPARIPERPRRLREIDELVIAPSGGFQSAEDYYAQTSPGPKLTAIEQPLTIYFSEDDPIVPVEPLFRFPRSASTEVITTPHGGHLACLARRNHDPDFYWLDWRILEWLTAGQAAGKKVQPHAAVLSV